MAYKFLTPPTFLDAEQNRKAQTLNAVLILQFLTVGITGALGVFFVFPEKMISGIALISALVLTILMKYLLNQGRAALASWFNGFIFWLITTSLVILAGGVSSGNTYFYFSLVVMVAVTAGIKASIFFAFLSLISFGGIAWLETIGRMPPQLIPSMLNSRLLLYTLALFWVAVPLSFTIKQLADALRQIQQQLENLIGAEQALQDREERYRLISSITSDYMFSNSIGMNSEIQLGWIAGAFEKISGYSLEEYEGLGGWRGLLHPDDVEQDREDFVKLTRNEPVITEIRTIHKDGSTRWARVYAHPVWDEENNQLSGIYGGVQDITTQKMAFLAEQRRARQLETLNKVGRAVSSLRDPVSLMEVVYEQARLIFLLDFFFISLYDPDTKLVSFPIMYNDGQRWNQPPVPLSETSHTAEAIATKKPVLVNDWSDNLPDTQLVGDLSKITTSLMFVPLLMGDEVTGVISVQSYTMNAYDDQDLDLLTGIASQVAIALENSRLFESTQRQLHELSILNAAALTSASLANEDEMIQEFVRIVGDAFQPDVFGVVLWDEGNQVLRGHPACQGVPAEVLSAAISLGAGVVGQVAATRQPIRLKDVSQHPEYVSIHPAIQSELCVPIDASGRLLGVINIESTTIAYTVDDENLLLTLAGQLAVALERLRAEAELRRLNESLEQRVAERTQALQAANKELNAFSYSVSHDLRAPLRAINGFSAFLEEIYFDQLGEEGQGYIQRIRENTLRMTDLINGMLELSRLGRKDLNKLTFAPADLVWEIINGLESEYEGRKVDFLVEDLPECDADPVLLRQVFTNLLSNSVKYTRKAEIARIEVASLKEGRETVYYIRDNGVGFDMQFADKLFHVFHRLHFLDDFEGTGVGLATVQRIIHRHGGRVWAEAVVDQGATFYFTLG